MRITSNEWIQQILKETKKENWNELAIEYPNIFNVEPSYYKSPSDRYAPILTSNHFRPKLGISILAENSKNANAQLLGGLKLGVNSPEIIISEEFDGNWAQVMKGVQCDWIEWTFASTNPADKIEIDHFFKEYPEIVSYRIKDNASIPMADDLDHCLDQFIAALWEHSSVANNKMFYFELQLNLQYLSNIGMLRALRKIYANYRAALKLDQEPFYLSVNIGSLEPITDSDSELIRNTIMGASAFIGGADRINIFRAQSDAHQKSGQRPRHAILIQHILEMESHLSKVVDPCCGSYWIEAVTDQIAREGWRRLQSIETNA